jgi:predicted dithiol-disulfide oxidoreductase (DUF899 family)
MTTTHAAGSREEWLTARLALLDAEKELTRRRDGYGLPAARAALGAGREGRPVRHRRRRGEGLVEGATYNEWLDRAPLGRNDGAGSWFRRHDEYDPQ